MGEMGSFMCRTSADDISGRMRLEGFASTSGSFGASSVDLERNWFSTDVFGVEPMEGTEGFEEIMQE